VGILNIDLYFIGFHLEKHPKLQKKLDDVAHAICQEEGIGVFHQDSSVMNAGRKKGHEAVGLYTYTECEEYQESVNTSRKRIEELEAKYGKPYKEVCALLGHDTKFSKADFVLPRITLCNSLFELGLTDYYSTFFHEIGHHFAVKEKGPDHDEMAADRYARSILSQRLPLHFQLIFDSHYKFRLKGGELRGKMKIMAYFSYLKYLITKVSLFLKYYISIS